MHELGGKVAIDGCSAVSTPCHTLLTFQNFISTFKHIAKGVGFSIFERAAAASSKPALSCLTHELDTQSGQSEKQFSWENQKRGVEKKKWHRADGTFNYTISRKSILNRIIKYPVDKNLAFIEVLVKVCHYYHVVILTTTNKRTAYTVSSEEFTISGVFTTTKTTLYIGRREKNFTFQVCSG